MRFGRLFVLLVLAAAVAAVAFGASWLTRPLALAGETAEVSIEPGRTPREIAEAWVRAGVRTSPLLGCLILRTRLDHCFRSGAGASRPSF